MDRRGSLQSSWAQPTCYRYGVCVRCNSAGRYPPVSGNGANTSTDGYTNAYPYGYTNTAAHSYPSANPYANLSTHACSHSNPYTNPDTYADSLAYPNANIYSCGHHCRG